MFNIKNINNISVDLRDINEKITINEAVDIILDNFNPLEISYNFYKPNDMYTKGCKIHSSIIRKGE